MHGDAFRKENPRYVCALCQKLFERRLYAELHISVQHNTEPKKELILPYKREGEK